LPSMRHLSIFLLCMILGVTVVSGTESEDPLVAPSLSEEPKTAELPILMYHLVTNNPRYINKHGISPQALEADLQYLKTNGYETVVIADLVRFVQKGLDLPAKPVMLTFDDGNSSDFHILLPLLQKYDMKAVVSVLGSAVDRCTKAIETEKHVPNLIWSQVAELLQSGHVELQCHSYDMHGGKGSGQQRGEAEADYLARFRADLEKNQAALQQHTGIRPNTFTYPLGIVTPSSETVLRDMGFVASLSCHDGMNYLTEGDSLFMLKRDNRPHNQSAEQVLRNMRCIKPAKPSKA